MFIGIKENDSTQGNEESEYIEHKGGHLQFYGNRAAYRKHSKQI